MQKAPPQGSTNGRDSGGAVVALLSEDSQLQSSFRDALKEAAPTLAAPVEVSTSPESLGPEDLLRLDYAGVGIVFVDLGNDAARALELTKALAAQRPERPVVLVGTTTDSELILKGVRAGASEFLGRPLTAEALGDALSRLAPRAPKAQDDRPKVSRVFAVLSGKGGTGVTTVAANLSISLAQATQRKTLLLDYDELGTAGLLMGLWPRFTFHDLVENFHRMDDELLESMVERHETGVDLLSSPLDATEPLTMSPDDVRRTIGFVRKSYDYVVMDLGRSLGPWMDAAVGEANDVLLVSTAEVTSIRNAKRILDRIGRSFSGMPSDIRVLVNQYSQDANVTIEELRETLGQPVFRTLPQDDQAARLAADTGRPIVLNNATRYSKDLRRLGADLAGSAVQNGTKPTGLKGRLSSLVRRKRGGTSPSSNPRSNVR